MEGVAELTSQVAVERDQWVEHCAQHEEEWHGLGRISSLVVFGSPVLEAR
ncbi:MAG: hypothetical protein GY696_37535 [Gammaproteobacteria bacterium]|nr:hypothetical protein [Gammaproteobacteria bacterium]